MKILHIRNQTLLGLAATLIICTGCASLDQEQRTQIEPVTDIPHSPPVEESVVQRELHNTHQEGTLCNRVEPCQEGTVCSGTACVAVGSLRWEDTLDGGDDSMNPGCHWEHTPANCSDPTFFAADKCLNSRLLSEYTDSSCHVGVPIDLTTHMG